MKKNRKGNKLEIKEKKVMMSEKNNFKRVFRRGGIRWGIGLGEIHKNLIRKWVGRRRMRNLNL